MTQRSDSKNDGMGGAITEVGNSIAESKLPNFVFMEDFLEGRKFFASRWYYSNLRREARDTSVTTRNKKKEFAFLLREKQPYILDVSYVKQLSLDCHLHEEKDCDEFLA